MRMPTHRPIRGPEIDSYVTLVQFIHSQAKGARTRGLVNGPTEPAREAGAVLELQACLVAVAGRLLLQRPQASAIDKNNKNAARGTTAAPRRPDGDAGGRAAAAGLDGLRLRAAAPALDRGGLGTGGLCGQRLGALDQEPPVGRAPALR